MVYSAAGVLTDFAKDATLELFARAQLRRLKAGEKLFQAGDVGDGCYRLELGLLKVTLVSPEVKEQIVAILTSGALVGDLAIIDGLPRSASVVALANCELRFVSRHAFDQFTREHPEIYQHLARMLASRLRQADEAIASMAFCPVKARVARALHTLADSIGEMTNRGEIQIPGIIHQTDIAAMAGVARENASRILSEWERQKLVTRSAGCYLIHDKAKLKDEFW